MGTRWAVAVAFGVLIALAACSNREKAPQPAPRGPMAIDPASFAPKVSKKAVEAEKAPTKNWLEFDPKALKISSGLDPEVFRRVVNKRNSTIKVCYRKALADDPAASGDVKLKIAITPTGRVSSVDVLENTLGHQEATDCLLRTVRRLRFPMPEGRALKVEIEYPFHFMP